MPEELVSVIVPVYNAAPYLKQTIDSVVTQTWPYIEIIIIDDGSSDTSLAIAKSYERENIKVFSQHNKGASAARNLGLLHATGNYIQFLDADDLLSPDKIAAQLHHLQGSDEHLCLCKTAYFDDDQGINNATYCHEWFIAGSNDPVDFIIKLYAGWDIIPGYGGMIQPNAWLAPAKIIQRAGLWNEALSVDDDGEFFCRVVLASAGIKYSRDGTNYYRKHRFNNSLSGTKNGAGYQSRLLALDLKFTHLKDKADTSLINAIFAPMYWEIGVFTYPQFRQLSSFSVNRAKELKYSGKKYHSGPFSNFLAKIFGWRVARSIAYLKQKYFN